jgi:hypothetical protein
MKVRAVVVSKKDARLRGVALLTATKGGEVELEEACELLQPHGRDASLPGLELAQVIDAHPGALGKRGHIEPSGLPPRRDDVPHSGDHAAFIPRRSRRGPRATMLTA